jgi:hypothetical protein
MITKSKKSIKEIIYITWKPLLKSLD